MIGDLLAKPWDVVVIGTGMGGGVLGRRLAERGASVLFIDRGPDTVWPERHALSDAVADPAERAALGYWPTPMHAEIDGASSSFFGPIGATVGGTSVFYAASLERPERHDIDDLAGRAHPTGGWPVGYDAFEPYFQAVEAMFEVCGDPDPLGGETQAPLASPPPLSRGDAALMRSFQRSGLHPYRTHLGIRYLPGCEECIGRACARGCKLDARSAGVAPALATGRAALLDRCEVTALRGTAGRVTHVEARRGGERLTIPARQVVLAAGSLASPAILLASGGAAWPNGCGNGSGLVGRNLMFHLCERIAVWPDQRLPLGRPAKTIALRDFYFRDGVRFGLFQSMGLDASYGNIVEHLNGRFDKSAARSLRGLRGALRIPALAASRVFGNARIFVGILEDLPLESNRVLFDPARPGRLAFTYAIGDELRRRRLAFRVMIKAALRSHRSFFLHRRPELNFGHPSGTLRFGADPARSVLDPTCRVHGIENLRVVDSSFMPTSMGVNPSLTIAANALRVADGLLQSRR